MLEWYITFFSLSRMDSVCLNTMVIVCLLWKELQQDFATVGGKNNVDMKLSDMQKKKMLFQKHSYSNIN